jgi:hypothetical protein
MWQYQRTEMSHKRKQKKNKIQEFMYRDTANVEHDMYGYTRGKWSHRNSNKRLKETFRSHTGKTFSRSAAEDTYTWNIAHITESIAA